MGLIGDFMDADHEFLDKLWLEFLKEDVENDNASVLFKRFQKYISMHISLEDNFLFPRFDEHFGFENETGPTTVAHRDHGNIIKLMDMIKENFLNDDVENSKVNGRHLHEALEKHRRRELEIQYKLLDDFISSKEWREALMKFYGKETPRE
ncbi:MAG TPA: hemerythrin domain-containing protein [Candidatus Bipolaricaulota bacterium]|nr:hemerythrin domain-containing protein [Candidatus Bipolaricaulota bacterium]